VAIFSLRGQLARNEFVEQRLVERTLALCLEYGCLDLVAPVDAQGLQHAVEGGLGCVGDEAEDGWVETVLDGFQDLWGEAPPRALRSW
jgi:hypothetical protein